MTHIPDEAATAKDNSISRPVGAAFTAAREIRKLSIEDVHNRLRIGPRQISALETDNFTVLPEPVITRGFIRNYARLLGIDAEPILAAYQASLPEEAPRAIDIHSENILISSRNKGPWLRYILASLLVIFLVVGWMAYDKYFAGQLKRSASSIVSTQVKPVEKSAVTNEPLPEAALPIAERTDQSPVTTDGTSRSAAEATVAPSALPEHGAAKPDEVLSNNQIVAAGEPLAKLKLTFSDQTWVSVTDRNNKEIFNKTGSAGSEDLVEGEPPLRVVIGNVAGVKLLFNDKLIDLEPYNKLNVARLTLE